MTSIERRQPSIELITEIDSCLSSINTLKDRIDKVLALGKTEGFTELEMGDIIRQRAHRMRLPSSTVRYYLPAAAKHQEKARTQVKQLAPDSISKVIRIEAQPSTVNTNEEFALNLGAVDDKNPPEDRSDIMSDYQQYEPKPEPDHDPLPNPDDSVLYSVPQDYKIELLEQYDEHYLRKVVKYQYDQIQDRYAEIKQLNKSIKYLWNDRQGIPTTAAET